LLSLFFIRNVSNGWLWTESVLKPISTVLNIGIFICAIIGMMYVYSMNKGVEISDLIYSVLNYTITIGDNNFYLQQFFKFCIFFAILIWATKWSREFSYRWVYSKTKDHGARNSLSVLTQYSILIIGIIIILYILEFPIQILTVALGGFAVAVGFGLRDIIGNYISGIILLIERPIRVGDFISVGGNQGKVTKIGMRSLTVENDDNMEVIVPNTETITSSLTNWTFKDTVIRMSFELRIDYNEDLTRIRQILSDILEANEDVLENPSPKVYFKEFSDSAVIAKINYHIDFNKSPSRGAVRTDLMLEIANKFHENEIAVAYPHKTMNINDKTDTIAN